MQDPHSLVISDSKAKMIFGDADYLVPFPLLDRETHMLGKWVKRIFVKLEAGKSQKK
ncbi:MAG: hypothetical protein U9N72_04645 [Bacteroidota bacterium]|nr:hypothetical protein [Bacteroidota bacterium]